ncbi:FAD:protein FMN transferase [Terasakiella sp. A23]|uniref:FAD:protein FMN transferase n=1 Tax=Terasakiella sp. FCG-A23 TaxID=3080561 RepID=UPI0029537F83|nr:FAD:protein FMN transferase [Terasakiella sp. A23]MDV7338818.1 FAD:protein FMN transferase [Terasakiella sp. A23]
MRFMVISMFVLMLSACDNGPGPRTETTFTGSTMGTTFNIKVINLTDSLTDEQVKSQINAILKDVNDKMSLWVKNSEIMKFNRSSSTDWQSVSKDLYFVTEAAQTISQQSNGYFDVTLEPLIKLWGFSNKDTNREPPEPEQIQAALNKIGYKKINLHAAPPAFRKGAGDLTINLSAIAKGFGIDQLSNYLESQKIENYMVEIGGDLRVRGTNATGKPWRVAIEKPDINGRAIHKIITVENAGMATSGDYRNYFEKEGKRFSHIIDPRTGYPVTHKLASVSVLSESAMIADGWATALLVMGEKEGVSLAENLGIAAYFLIREEDGFVEKQTSHFANFKSHAK